jgi:hypothetical protein
MNRSTLLIFAASLAGACALQAQTNPLIAEAKAQYTAVKTNFVKAAEKMPEEAYDFKPTPDVQSFGERMMHIAGQIRTCATVKGEQKTFDANKKAKSDIVAALKASFDECDAAWDSMTDASAAEMLAGRGGQTSKLGTLIRNTNHDSELYGYICVYMRLKGVVPPSSEGGGMGRGGR